MDRHAAEARPTARLFIAEQGRKVTGEELRGCPETFPLERAVAFNEKCQRDQPVTLQPRPLPSHVPSTQPFEPCRTVSEAAGFEFRLYTRYFVRWLGKWVDFSADTERSFG